MNAKELLITFAKYNEEADKAVVAILDKLSNEDREKNRKSYYGSLSSLARHALGGAYFFLTMFKEATAKNAAAQKALAPLAKVEIIEAKKITGDQWKKVTEGIKITDKAYVNFVSALTDKDLEAPIKLDWYGGKPASVPLYFMLQQLTAHGTHHRGQISQILDSLKIDNDYSGVSVKFLSK
ncbi:DinB family protein [Leadbettera azotonutricia]|uniref:DinB family n=1 Tax=Leadbettera azotonutricia (strain ATCC BAA-888 / DSM 13862 / ZAS-9) TaxID=545695 RepID=F5Y965_LEAAZ|nr:DinB family protein [Leadbettera azotonutricia]AEF80758.1 DinB family [Leadbettera azotonutricia ZAS-9]